MKRANSFAIWLSERHTMIKRARSEEVGSLKHFAGLSKSAAGCAAGPAAGSATGSAAGSAAGFGLQVEKSLEKPPRKPRGRGTITNYRGSTTVPLAKDAH